MAGPVHPANRHALYWNYNPAAYSLGRGMRPPHRAGGPLLATYFLGTFALPFTYWLEPFQYLFDHVPMLRNIRAMANTMPRDIPAVLAALLAGMGLDAILAGPRRSMPAAAVVVAAALGVALAAGILALHPAFLPMRHSLAHIAVYLGLSALILVPLLRWSSPRART